MEVTIPSLHAPDLAPAGQHVLSAHVMYIPYELEGGWTELKRTALQAQFGLKDPPDIARQEQLMEPYRPYRSLVSYYLWRSLANPATD